MASLAVDLHLVNGDVRGGGTDVDGDLSAVVGSSAVEPVDHVAVVDGAVPYHGKGASGQLFFSGLEEELDPSPDQVLVLGKELGEAEQGGAVAVVAAGVHDPVDLGGVGKSGALLDRKGVDVSPESHRRAGLVSVEDAHYAGAGDPVHDGDAALRQEGLDEGAGLILLEGELRVHVQLLVELDLKVLVLAAEGFYHVFHWQ